MSPIHSHPTFITPNTPNPNKPLFIFLPSMEGSGQLLRKQAAGLEIKFDVRCLVIPPDDLTSWDVLTETVIELIQGELSKNKVAPTAYLGGESFGACLALNVATHSPHLFSHILLINSASSFGKRPWMLWGGQIIRWFPKDFYKISSLGLLPFLAALERISPENQQALIKAICAVPKETSLWRLNLIQDFSLDDLPLNCLTQPILVIAGAADRLLPSVTEAEELVQRLPNAQLYVLPESGHASLIEEDVNLDQIMASKGFLPISNSPWLSKVASTDGWLSR